MCDKNIIQSSVDSQLEFAEEGLNTAFNVCALHIHTLMAPAYVTVNLLNAFSCNLAVRRNAVQGNNVHLLPSFPTVVAPRLNTRNYRPTP